MTLEFLGGDFSFFFFLFLCYPCSPGKRKLKILNDPLSPVDMKYLCVCLCFFFFERFEGDAWRGRREGVTSSFLSLSILVRSLRRSLSPFPPPLTFPFF